MAAAQQAPPPAGGPMLKFCTLESRVDIGFWSELATRKLDRYKLSDAPVPIQGTLAASRYAEIASRLELDKDAFVDEQQEEEEEEAQTNVQQTAAAAASDEAAVVAPRSPQQQQQQQQPKRHRAPGTLLNSNSLDEFRALDRQELLRETARAIWRDVRSGAAVHDPSRLLRFFLVAHGDLKRYAFHYQFCFPALRPPAAFVEWAGGGARPVGEGLGGQGAAAAALEACDAWRRGRGGEEREAAPAPFWLVRMGGGGEGEGTASCHPLSAWQQLRQGRAEAPDLLVAMADPCHLPLVPGWPLRNLLLLASARWAGAGAAARGAPPDGGGGGGTDDATSAAPLRLRVLCVRDGSTTGRASGAEGRSFVVDVAVPPLPDGWKGHRRCEQQETAAAAAAAAAADEDGDGDKDREEAPDALGWEPDVSGKPVPRELDLSPHLSPLALAEQAVALNLRLMRWRAAPSLDLPRVARCRCLLLGAGTLGCALARTLLAWGVRRITLLDSGRVAYSNPVRQSLFEHSDCLDGGRPKAAAAAEALGRIFPGAEARAVEMRIPMPGHPPSAGEDLEADASRLDALVAEHDAVFLLTDTRESRWLPTLLAAARGKIALTAALGFDGYLVMRHGTAAAAGADDDDDDDADDAGATARTTTTTTTTSTTTRKRRVGCYFCQDVVAPADSTRARALDQQCTVARPGLAPIAGALSAELLAALLQHPLGMDAPAMGDEQGPAGAAAAAEGGAALGAAGGGGGDQGAAAEAAEPPALGPVPHMIRGQLNGFSQVCMSGRAFPQCTACGPAVVRAWRERGAALVREAAADPSALERLTGLAALREEAEARMAAVDLEETTGTENDEEVEGGGEAGGGKEGGDGDDWVDL